MEFYPPEAVSLKDCPSKGINRLKPGEFMISCPYDKNHQVVNSRFYSHREKCRMNYEIKHKTKGQAPLKLTCKYNSKHEIFSPELFFHEHTCSDKDKLLLDHLLMDQTKINSILAGDFDQTKFQGLINPSVDDYQPGAAGGQGGFMANLGSIFDQGPVGIYMNLDKLAWDLVIAGKVESLLSFPAVEGLENGKVAWADPSISEEKGISTLISHLELGKLTQVDDPLFHRRRRYTRTYRVSQEPPKKLGIVEEEEDLDSEEYWAKTSNQTFDWYKHQFTWRPEGTAPMKYPPGLSKSQRKAFVKWNTERLKTEHGIVLDYDEAMKELRAGREDGKTDL